MSIAPEQTHRSGPRDRIRDARRALAIAASRLSRQIAVGLERARSALRIRRGVHAGACYYKELTAERLGPALAARRAGADGYKDYRVTFQDGSKMHIRCTRQRCYADLMGPESVHRYARVAPLLRPGSRVLDVAMVPMTTGYGGDWLAEMVGPSGSVVLLTPDEQGARFASRRYQRDNLSVEHLPLREDAGAAGLHEALAGETANAFDAAIHLGLPHEPERRDPIMRELWRTLAPGGWLLAGVRLTSDPDDAAVRALREHLATLGQVVRSADIGPGVVLDVLLRKPAPEVEPKMGV